MNTVPFIDLKRSINKIKENVLTEWETCLDNAAFINGPHIKELEIKLSSITQTTRCTACSNGTDAIIIGLQALGVKPGDKIAVPNLTFWAPIEAVLQLGGIPILIDMDADDLQINFNEYKVAFDKFRFKFAIICHLYGWASEKIKEFRKFSLENDILLLEDGAQSFGVLDGDKPIYSSAKISTISFYPAKVLGASGDGGGIFTNDNGLADKCLQLINHGRKDHYSYDTIGWNGRMANTSAVFVLKMLNIIDEVIKTRLKAIEYYNNFFSDYRNLIKVFNPPSNIKSNGYLSVFLSPNKSGDEIVSFLSKHNIGAARTYPETMDSQRPLRDAPRISDLKISKDFCKKVFNLPLFGYITEKELEASTKTTIKAVT